MEYKRCSDIELLSILLGPKAARKLASGGLAHLLFSDELKIPKLAAAKELLLRTLRQDLEGKTMLSSPTAVRDYLRTLFLGKEHEAFVVVSLDAQHRVNGAEELFRGSLTSTSVYPREVVKHALRRNAAAVIFAHNHPSGVAEPSAADEVLTGSLKGALALVDVRVLDHFVIAGAYCVSFAERGLI